MNRFEFQALAVERLSDAEALLKAGRYACAYYIAGYAIECALKACIARKTNQDDFPPKDAQRYYTHDVRSLLESAGLGSALGEKSGLDPIFKRKWASVKDWNEGTRYLGFSREQAEDIVSAVNDPQHGVLQWLRQSW